MTASTALSVANMVIGLFLAIICLAIGFGPRPSKALRLLGIGGILHVAGAIAQTALHLDWPGLLLYGLSILLTAGGLLANSRWSIGRRGLVPSLAVVVPLLTLYHLGQGPDLLRAMGSPKSIADISFTFAAIVLMIWPPRDATLAARVLGGGLFLMGAFSVTRPFVLPHLFETSTPATAEIIRGLSLLPLVLTSALVPVGSLWIEVRRAHAELERIAYLDELTGLPNRRAALERFEVELARAFRQKTELALIVFDIDRFKQVNDDHGHLVGDGVLKEVARKLLESKRIEDVAGRLGGEEFVVVMNGISPEAAEQAANRFRREIAARTIESGAHSLRPTLSGGVASFPTDGTTWDELFAAADRRLYAAKQRGRNRVVGPPAREQTADPSQTPAAV